MKIAVTTSGDTLQAAADPRFGRAPTFLIYETETGAFYLKPNTQNLNAAQGAGIQSALTLSGESVDGVITGHCGPKAFATLDAAGITVYTCPNATIGLSLEKLQRGELKAASEADVEAHWV